MAGPPTLNRDGSSADAAAEAMDRPDRVEWLERPCWRAGQHGRHTCAVLVDLPDGSKALGCRWVFSIKSDGRVVTLSQGAAGRAGLRQRHGDFEEVYAPSVRTETLRAVASQADDAFQPDIKTAFLNGELRGRDLLQQLLLGAGAKGVCCSRARMGCVRHRAVVCQASRSLRSWASKCQC
jgi:hypothetical protein